MLRVGWGFPGTEPARDPAQRTWLCCISPVVCQVCCISTPVHPARPFVYFLLPRTPAAPVFFPVLQEVASLGLRLTVAKCTKDLLLFNMYGPGVMGFVENMGDVLLC
jgi:hypothetical protein